MGKYMLQYAAYVLIKRHFQLPRLPMCSPTGAGNSTKPRTILKCHQECQEKSYTPPGKDSRVSSSLPQCTVLVNKRAAWFKVQLHLDWLSLTMLLQTASKPDNHFLNKMEIQGLIFANIINSFFPLHPPSSFIHDVKMYTFKLLSAIK